MKHKLEHVPGRGLCCTRAGCGVHWSENVPDNCAGDDAGEVAILSLTERIIEYENGQLEESEVVELFQDLIDTGLAWTLQGHYGRTAMALVEAGECRRK